MQNAKRKIKCPLCPSRLSSVKCLATDISAEDCTDRWLNGVAKSGTFTKDKAMNDWPRGENGIPNR